MSMVTIVDYGVGNLFNIQKAFKSIGAGSKISNDPEEIAGSSKLVLPGVGSFEAGITALKESGTDEVVKEFAASGRPLMGICLGMQLMLSTSEENGKWAGLDLIEGKVVRFTESKDTQENYKIPQIGWNSISKPTGMEIDWNNTLLKSLDPTDTSYLYFIHSYYVAPDDEQSVIAETTYGQDTFCSVVMKDNVVGCQFHPERSGKRGLQILEAFIGA